MSQSRTKALSDLSGFEELNHAELARMEGGFLPMWDPITHQIVTCTDPRRWTPQFPP